MIRFYYSIKCRIFIIKSDMVMFESMGTFRYIYIQKIFTIFNLIPEIKSSCAMRLNKFFRSNEFLCIDKIPNYWFYSKFLDNLSSHAFFPRFTYFKCTSRETIKSSPSVSRCCLAEKYLPFVYNNSTNFRSDKIFSIFHG